MINSLTYTSKRQGPDPSQRCPAVGTRVQLHEQNIQEEKRRCWGCGRMMVIPSISVQQGLTVGYAAFAVITEHRPHT